MDDQKKVDNVVKIFAESLKESKDFPDSKIDNVARSIVQVLSQLYDPSKKEFRDKVNVLKMKLKGSRNNSARLALLQDKIQPADFVNLPQEKHNQEYFDSLISSNDSQSKPAPTQAPPTRVNNQAISNQIRGNAPPPRGISRPGGARVMPPQPNSFRPVIQQSQEQSADIQNEQNNNEEIQNLQKDNIEENNDAEQKQITPNASQQAKELSQQPPKQNQDNAQQIKKVTANQNIKAEETPEKVQTQQSKVNKQQPQIPTQQLKQVNQQADKPQIQQLAQQQQQEEGEEKDQEEQQQQQQNLQAPPPIARGPNPIAGRTIPQNQQSRLKQLPGQKKVQQQQVIDEDQKKSEQVKLPPVGNQLQEEQKPDTKLQPTQKTVQIQEKQNNSSQQQPIKNLPTKQNEDISKQSQKSQQPQSSSQTQPPVVQTQDINKQAADTLKAKQQQNAKNNLQNNQSIPPKQANQAPIQQTKQQQINQQSNQLQSMQNQQRAINQPQQSIPTNTQQQKLLLQQNQQQVQQQESYSDEEGECEDAHVSQLKSQLDDFKRTKQQLEAEYYDEQVLDNLSNEDDYSQYDDDESYEDPNKPRSDDRKNNQEDQYSDEYEVQQKQVSPQKQAENQKQTVKQVEATKDSKESNVKQKSYQENQKQDRTHEYQLHQQIENQKLQEELQKKQAQVSDTQLPKASQKANNPTHNSAQIQQQNTNHQIDTHFTTSQSSKQTQSKQKLEEMSDFEKIEFNPALRNEEFDDQNEEDVIHHIQNDQKNHNFDQKNGGFANPFQIQVPQKSHQRTLSSVVVKQEDQESIDRLKNVQVPVRQSVSPKANVIKSGSKKIVKGPDGEQIEVTNSDNEDFASDNMQNILQGLTDQEQSKKGTDKESTDELQGEEQEREDELLEGEEQKLYQDEINVDVDIPADFSQASEKKQNQLLKNSPLKETFEENESTKQQKSRKESTKSESQRINQKLQQQYEDDLDTNNAKDLSGEYESDGELKIQNYSSSQNARLQEENKQLKAKLRQILQDQSKREELNKRALIEKDKKNKLLESQVKETQDEIFIIKQYLDQIIEENLKQKQQYEEIKLSFGQNEHQLREELSQLKQKIKVEYTNEIQQLRSVNQVLIQNNEHLQSALDSLASDLEQKDLIIQKLTLHSSEQVNRSYQNINSKSLNYSSANTVQPPQQIIQQKAQPSSYIQQQQLQPAQISPQQINSINYPQQKQTEEQIEQQPIQNEEQEEENNHEEIEMNAQAELEIDLQQHPDNENDVDNNDGIDEQEHENIDKETAGLKNYEEEEEGVHNHQLNEDEGDDRQEGKHEEDIQDHRYDDLDQNAQQIQVQEQISQSSPVYHHISENQNLQQYDDAENFFNQLLPGTKQQTPILEPSPVQQQEVNKNITNQSGASATNNQTKSVNKKSNSNVNPSSKNQRQLPPNKKDSLSEQIVNLGGIIGDDIHNQSNSNFFDINSIPNVPTTSELRSSHNNKISNQKQIKNQIDLNPAENTFFSTENDFFNTVTSDKFNTSNISAIPNPFNSNNFFNNNFSNPFQEPQSNKAKNSKQTGQKRVRNTGGNLFS
ncbi:hypothetical protein TTHERM_00144840 (macronuclear) [Tetrahymena thermophila SB210]|uniref:Uncharacterized protein n=1 Tax=Tetrahymena thermophila (strain SB210) TaxID=312017 RepID=I7MI49_TETTS|nr:hypothetical protein TTHERM_00144840 [Tetrahymena thermophila SB210]EAR90879.1 hypothetical protein TTHERM_00144840 [Tetrahymena thermophila SB210]|eukprot:XP_001011124.1 hypothetical protein TTHERM_00144840 [Tetrahymena thermophila SB210]